MKGKSFLGLFSKREKPEFPSGLNSLAILVPFLASFPLPTGAKSLFPSALVHRFTIQLTLEVGLGVCFKNAAVSISGNPPGGSRCVEYLYMYV